MTKMNCYYYKLVNKANGKVILANIGWASSFKALAENKGTSRIACIQITKDEFNKLQ